MKHNQCNTCKYAVNLSKSKRKIVCYYSVLSGKGSCLKMDRSTVVDQRGSDPNNCMLYTEGPTVVVPWKIGGKNG